MAERLKVVNELRDCIRGTFLESDYSGEKQIMCSEKLIRDAIRLLVDQMPVEPKCYPETRYSGPVFACGECHHELETARPRFCMFCGKPIKWE